MVVLIVLIVTIGGVVKHRAQAKRWMSDSEERTKHWVEEELEDLWDCDDDGAGSGKLKKRIDALEARVRTLERIATDQSEQLRRDIDSL